MDVNFLFEIDGRNTFSPNKYVKLNQIHSSKFIFGGLIPLYIFGVWTLCRVIFLIVSLSASDSSMLGNITSNVTHNDPN